MNTDKKLPTSISISPSVKRLVLAYKRKREAETKIFVSVSRAISELVELGYEARRKLIKK